MDHQPFETWIVGPPTQKPEDAHALQQHLEACPTCRTLQSNWQSAEQALKRAPQLSPRPGFNTRWQSSLAERRTRQHIRQVRTLLLTLGLAVGLDSGVERLAVRVGVERFENGAHVTLIVSQRSDAPDELIQWIAAPTKEKAKMH